MALKHQSLIRLDQGVQLYYDLERRLAPFGLCPTITNFQATAGSAQACCICCIREYVATSQLSDENLTMVIIRCFPKWTKSGNAASAEDTAAAAKALQGRG